MKKSDFTKGQTVYLFIIAGSNAHRDIKDKPFKERILPATVLSVGSKYITVRPDKWNFDEVRFCVDKNFQQKYEAGGADYDLFLSEQDIYDCEESESIYYSIKNGFSSWKNKGKYSLDQLSRIKAIMEESKND